MRWRSLMSTFAELYSARDRTSIFSCGLKHQSTQLRTYSKNKGAVLLHDILHRATNRAPQISGAVLERPLCFSAKLPFRTLRGCDEEFNISRRAVLRSLCRTVIDCDAALFMLARWKQPARQWSPFQYQGCTVLYARNACSGDRVPAACEVDDVDVITHRCATIYANP